MEMNPAYADTSSEETKMDPLLSKFMELAMSLTKKELLSKEAYDAIKKAVESCKSEGKDKQISEEDPEEASDDNMESEDPRVVALIKFSKTLGVPLPKKK